MKKIIRIAMISAAAVSSTGWAQGTAAPSGSTDPIVQMHMQIDAANKAYDRKVAAAKKVFDSKKAAAAKERDAAIAQARNGTGQ
ncbi:hypothetical protein EVC45_20750 [Paraburkholderia sp. UYCP14C]|uniref:hypothetical protein n=1 Tax=Paraburkholderia sp. UYCP14C TaxID=2511130 RepID=UPI00101F4D98|nr:hypothetical protein [Paraburkholderia sp. UYCP14C]RZF27915.1 hypothetical protein EVC45_20750 [Paraburkholderia sp. UYCP14C]